jgi:TfoX/Sxy family transcriptional regulator of competence genes
MTTGDVEHLADRVHAVVGKPGIMTKKMFGGITFLLNGNMLCCASRKGLMVRVGAAAEPRALESPHAKACLGAGRRMAGFLMIDPEGIDGDDELEAWIALARGYVGTLAPKAAGEKRPRKSMAETVSNRKKGRKA